MLWYCVVKIHLIEESKILKETKKQIVWLVDVYHTRNQKWFKMLRKFWILTQKKDNSADLVPLKMQTRCIGETVDLCTQLMNIPEWQSVICWWKEPYIGILQSPFTGSCKTEINLVQGYRVFIFPTMGQKITGNFKYNGHQTIIFFGAAPSPQFRKNEDINYTQKSLHRYWGTRH